MSQERAIADIDLLVAELQRALGLAGEAKAAAILGDAGRFGNAVDQLEDIGEIELTTSTIYDHLEELQRFDAKGARADERFDYERDARVQEQAG